MTLSDETNRARRILHSATRGSHDLLTRLEWSLARSPAKNDSGSFLGRVQFLRHGLDINLSEFCHN